MLRKMAVILALVVGLEIVGILMMPTYETELDKAKAEYEAAVADHEELVLATSSVDFGG